MSVTSEKCEADTDVASSISNITVEYFEKNSDSERGSNDSRGQWGTPRSPLRKSLAWKRNEIIRDETPLKTPLVQIGDATSYAAYGEGLSRRRSVSQLQTSRSYALDIETTKPRVDDEVLDEKVKSYVMYPWNLSNAKVEINQDAKISSFSDIKFLCNGKNSHIFKAKAGEKPVVIKKLFASRSNDPVCLHEFKFEVEFLKRAVSCKSIVEIIESGHDAEEEEEAQTEKEMEGGIYRNNGGHNKGQIGNNSKLVKVPFIVLECLNGGSLTYRLTKKRPFGGRPFSDNAALYSHMISLAEALHFLHYGFDPSVNVIHRDVKPDNVAFTEDGRLKLIDFGLSICVKRFENASDTYNMTGETGSLRYMAPEVIMNNAYNCKADVFSFAVVSWEMCTGVVPYAGKSKKNFIEHVVERKQRPGLHMDPYGQRVVQPDKIKKLWSLCWHHDINKRMTMKEILDVLRDVRDSTDASISSTCVCN